ncbi:MAG: NAD(P)H-binding protein [Gammaproteobacteria bacterium]|nr:NAD(P)H-binding protein [Gammaproteobacteria bacterium]
MNNPPPRTAAVVGATGLVGTCLVSQLLADPDYHKVITVARREVEVIHPGHQHIVLDFEDRQAYAEAFNCDVLFSALGTTRKLAGNQQKQFRVDHDYQLWAAEAAHANGAHTCVLVSAAGAHATSAFFYSRLKARLETDLIALGFARTCILRPGLLDGDRTEHRPGEQAALRLLRMLPTWILPASLRPMPVTTVARIARLAVRTTGVGVSLWEAAEIFARAPAVTPADEM